MTTLHPSTIDELCNTLGLRASYPVRSAAAQPLSDEQMIALGVLAAPEAIAVISHRGEAVTHVIATRGPWLAEHVIDGDVHHIRADASDLAALLLLDRCGLTSPCTTAAATIDVPVASYRRVHELVRIADVRRARATLIAEGTPTAVAADFVDAMRAGVIDVAGLGSDGRRFTGCDLAVAGDASTSRWLVPTVQHVDPLPRSAFHHPSLCGLRVLLERVGRDVLVDELALIFGDA